MKCMEISVIFDLVVKKNNKCIFFGIKLIIYYIRYKYLYFILVIYIFLNNYLLIFIK